MVRTEPDVKFGNPVEMPKVPRPGVISVGPRAYDVLLDGPFKGHFICIVPESNLASDGGPRSQELHLVVNWFEELKRQVPAQ